LEYGHSKTTRFEKFYVWQRQWEDWGIFEKLKSQRMVAL
jgi:hypothetical protein